MVLKTKQCQSLKTMKFLINYGNVEHDFDVLLPLKHSRALSKSLLREGFIRKKKKKLRIFLTGGGGQDKLSSFS